MPKNILSYLAGFGKPAKKGTKNTRQHRRVRAFNLIKFTLSDGTEYESLSNVVDISESGLQFTCYEELQTDQSIKMLIHVPHANEDAEVKARLVWVKKMQQPRGVFVAGVRFEKLTDRHKALICEMVELGRQSR